MDWLQIIGLVALGVGIGIKLPKRDGMTPMLFGSARRSAHWPKTRAEHLAKNPTCAACGTDQKLTVHHIKPFHINPELELDPNNLITLCEGVMNCHLRMGHLGNFRSYCVSIAEDAAIFLAKVQSRP